MTSDELLPLPAQVQYFLHCQGMGAVIVEGPQYNAICEWIIKAANLQSAKPADALGSLPVVAEVVSPASSDTGRVVAWYESHENYRGELTDHAQATAEIAKRDERVEFWANEASLRADEIERLEAKLAGVDGLVEALRGLVAWADDLTRDDPVEDLRKARAALATYEAAQEKK